MGNCICSSFTFCPLRIGRVEPIVPASIDVTLPFPKDYSPVQRPQLSLPLQLDQMLEQQGGVYYLPPHPVEPCSPLVARRSNSGEKGQSVRILVSKQQLELLVRSAKNGQFDERVMQFVTKLGATGEDLFRKWRPDLATIHE
ncbi:hypothetical protein QQ045_007107 [Rhodiola kirilowii]